MVFSPGCGLGGGQLRGSNPVHLTMRSAQAITGHARMYFTNSVTAAVFSTVIRGKKESESVIMIKECSIDFQDVSDLLGIEYMDYTNGHIEAVCHPLAKALNELYEELGGKDEEVEE